MPPESEHPYLSEYELARTGRPEKEAAVSNFDDFLSRLLGDDVAPGSGNYSSTLLTAIFIEMGRFKYLRNTDKKNRLEQNRALFNIYSLLKSVDTKMLGIKFKERLYDDPDKLMVFIYTIMKNSSIFAAEIPESLKFIVNKYSPRINRDEITINESLSLDYLIDESAGLKNRNKLRLDGIVGQRAIAREEEARIRIESAKKIQNAFKGWKENDSRTGGSIQKPGSLKPDDTILIRSRIYEHLKIVSQHYGFVPTAFVVNEFLPIEKEFNRLKEILKINPSGNQKTQQQLKAVRLEMKAKSDESAMKSADFRKHIKEAWVQGIPETDDDIIADFDYSISKKVGSCGELARTLYLLLKNDPHLISINSKVRLLKLNNPHDHIFAAVKNLSSYRHLGGLDPSRLTKDQQENYDARNTLIVDAWLKHVNLMKNVTDSSNQNGSSKLNHGNNFRTENVDASKRERGFFGSQDSYINFLNNHVDGQYVKEGKLILVEENNHTRNEENTLTRLKDRHMAILRKNNLVIF